MYIFPVSVQLMCPQAGGKGPMVKFGRPSNLNLGLIGHRSHIRTNRGCVSFLLDSARLYTQPAFATGLGASRKLLFAHAKCWPMGCVLQLDSLDGASMGLEMESAVRVKAAAPEATGLQVSACVYSVQLGSCLISGPSYAATPTK